MKIDDDQIRVVITSVSSFSRLPLSYSKVRSYFTAEQRENQTLETIRSVKKKLPSAEILLIEAGTDKIRFLSLAKHVTKALYFGDNLFVKIAVQGKHKGLGEIMMMFFAWREISCRDKFVIKISGRYALEEKFNLKTWDSQKFNFLTKENGVSTRLYGLPHALINNLYIIFLRSIPGLLKGKSLENLIYCYLNQRKINHLPELGIYGQIGISGDLIKE